MGTQCAERQEAAYSSRQHCHHRGAETKWEGEREGKKGRKGHYSPTLFIFYPQQAHGHTMTKPLNTHRHRVTHMEGHTRRHACRQRCMWKEESEQDTDSHTQHA